MAPIDASSGASAALSPMRACWQAAQERTTALEDVIAAAKIGPAAGTDARHPLEIAAASVLAWLAQPQAEQARQEARLAAAQAAAAAKAKGNQAYQRGRFDEAAALYGQAARTAAHAGEHAHAEANVAVCLANRSAALVGLHEWPRVLADVAAAFEAGYPVAGSTRLHRRRFIRLPRRARHSS